MTNSNKVISALNQLIETCKDGEKGFREASEAIHNGYFHILFKEYARRRGQFVSQLRTQVRFLGGEPERKGSVAGTLHRGWMNLRTALNKGKDELVIFECERGEEAAVHHYEQVLKLELPSETRSLLEEQLNEINATLRRVKAMEVPAIPGV
ncbi:MAG TPA: PA2169 family four-helix-bundle protein [Acidobacteriota bacterium]|nr:PA2169 family four-helix-bundle protein [Acidobacteriota bacterium]